jgi:hypothetical protein
MPNYPPLAVFLHGSIGVGKTTLGTALVARLGGAYVDGDDFQKEGRPWFASSRTVARALADAALAQTALLPLVVLGYPLRCTDYLYLRTRLSRAGLETLFINLVPPLSGIMAEGRGRIFSTWERERTAEMIEQGYNSRPWSDARVDTSGTREHSLRMLTQLVRSKQASCATGSE